MNQTPILHAYYDLRVAPVSFDFATYLAIACGTARKQGAALSVNLFYPQFRRTASERAIDETYLSWKVNNVLVRLCQLCPTVVEVVANRSVHIKFLDPHFPPNYHPAKIDLKNPFTQVPSTPLELDAVMEGLEDRVIFKSTAYADKWFARHFSGPKPVVTMSVRATHYSMNRNTPLELWHQVYRAISEAGYRVLVIPDQDDYLGDKTYTQFDWEIVGDACLDMDLRLSLYRNSLGVIAWNGGPSTLLPICGSNFIAFGVWNEANAVACREFFSRKGPRFGEQPHWFVPGRQHYDWRESKDVTADYILEKSLPWLRTLDKRAIAG